MDTTGITPESLASKWVTEIGNLLWIRRGKRDSLTEWMTLGGGLEYQPYKEG